MTGIQEVYGSNAGIFACNFEKIVEIEIIGYDAYDIAEIMAFVDKDFGLDVLDIKIMGFDNYATGDATNDKIFLFGPPLDIDDFGGNQYL